MLKPRVAGFIAVGGSLTSQWKTLALPILHTVDVLDAHGGRRPGAVRGRGNAAVDRARDADAIARAALLGRNVATQIGRSFDDAEYRGDPACARSAISTSSTLRGSEVECATCGARGRSLDGGGRALDRPDTSVISMDEKRAHFAEILDTAKRHAEQREEIESRAASYAAFDRLVRPPGRN